ncbi:acetyltransferase [Flavobacterium terrigena]|uniref:Sugar O-acyltransferase, sialic acid O-acetyltransferase NeuD family n=1 Tax=Flavobacterium terrigena TaxID=402734 RepID=A0A1H6TQ97_9FLAO|nr:acetyltransferase [Flavobacterium terrigena]SEI79387.1 sugar O-acyltransferase, sialic acid O-acetyltransferase NeuD family [Flavobacterium terrigena]
MNKILAIIGSGDLGQQIAHYAISDMHYEKVVFIDDFTTEKTVLGHEVIGKTDQIEFLFEQKKFSEILIGIGYKHLQIRKEIFEKYSKTLPFGKIIHSTAWLDSTAIVKSGSVIYPRCSLDANVVVEENSILNIATTIAHDTTIGKHCFLSPRVAIAGFVSVKEQCIIGINSTIIDNIVICNNTQIGGGTVVIKNIEKKGLYVGNPAKFIR